jgi:hypothetical protein
MPPYRRSRHGNPMPHLDRDAATDAEIGLYVLDSVAFLFLELECIAMTQQEILDKLRTLSNDVDALIAGEPVPTPPVDLQPIADAIDALDTRVKAATGTVPAGTVPAPSGASPDATGNAGGELDPNGTPKSAFTV